MTDDGEFVEGVVLDDDDVDAGPRLTHGLGGQFMRTLDGAERDAQCARLRQRGMTWRQVGEEVGLHESSARQAAGRAMKAAVQEAGDELRQLELARLDSLWGRMADILEKDHVTVSQGRVVRDAEGNTIPDFNPKMQAADRMLRIMDRRAKLMGLDAAVRADLRVSNGVDRSIEQFAEEFGIMAELAAAAEAEAVGGGGEEAP